MTATSGNSMEMNDSAITAAIVHGYSQLIAGRIESGWAPSLVTFMFSPLPGGRPAIVQQMRREIEDFYSRLVTRTVRRPRSRAALGALPVLIAVPDAPVFKRCRPRLIDVVVNAGIHAHGMLLLPPVSRLRVSAEEHIRQNRAVYINERSRLDRVHVVPIMANSDFVTEYAMKGLRARRFDGDDIIVLPRSFSEPSRRSALA